MKAITQYEYNILYNEMLEKLKNQDKYINIIISILGLGNILEKLELIENLSLLFLIMIITLILQLRIMANRNTVMYISSYLCVLSENSLTDVQWESKVSKFKSEGYGIIGDKLTVKDKIINFVYKSGRKIQHFGIASLSIYTLIQIGINLIGNEKIHIIFRIALLLFAAILLTMNMLCTYTICIDDCIKNSYKNRWKIIIDSVDKQE